MPDHDFIKSCLKSLLGNDTSDDIADYVLSIETEDDFTEFMQDIVNQSVPEHRLVYQKLKNNLFETAPKGSAPAIKKPPPVKPAASPSAPKAAKMPQPPKAVKPAVGAEPRAKKSGDLWEVLTVAEERNVLRDDAFHKALEPKFETLSVECEDFESFAEAAPDPRAGDAFVPAFDLKVEGDEIVATNGKGKKKKRVKYVKFFDIDTKVELRKGRHPCECQASRHKLINNCLSCGRIVCEQEGSGPCFFCDEMVCTAEEMEVLASDSRQSHKLYNNLMEQKTSKEWKKAIELRNKLLSIDQEGDGKCVVIDDQNDFYDVNNTWNTEEERRRVEKLRRDFYTTRHKPMSERKVTLNIGAGGVTATTDNELKKFEERMLRDVTKRANEVEELFEQQRLAVALSPPKKTGQVLGAMNRKWSSEYLREARDKLLGGEERGMCLSMHQPYASLLVAGIKKHEGRSWSTSHRGPLWIASTAQEADECEICEMEAIYKALYDDENLEFPETYPRSCLLGCVYVEDCLTQSEYREKYPNGESSSPFVFICSNAVALPVFMPISGRQKIYNLDKGLHQRAKAGLNAVFSLYK